MSPSADAEFPFQQALQLFHRSLEFPVKRCALSLLIRESQGMGHTMGEGAVGVGCSELCDEPIYPGHMCPCLPDFFERSGFGDFPGGNTLKLTAVEDTTTHRALVIDEAGALSPVFPMSRTGLKKKLHTLLATQLQADCCELSGGIAEL